MSGDSRDPYIPSEDAVVPPPPAEIPIPDVLLLALRFILGTTVSAVIALMVMHLVVVAVAVPAYMWASRSN